MLKKHISGHKSGRGSVIPRVRPLRVAKRQRELMVIVAHSENGPEDAE